MNDRQAHITHFEPRTHRVQVIAPSRGNSSGSKAVDFATFYCIRVPMFIAGLWIRIKRTNWSWVAVLACMAVMATGLFNVADSLDWINVAALFGSKS